MVVTSAKKCWEVSKVQVDIAVRDYCKSIEDDNRK